VSWLWDFDDGGTSTQQNPSHSFDDDGSYLVTLTVTDDDGAMDTYSDTVTVSNVAPTADYGYSPNEPSINDVITFTDESFDSDGSIVSWMWDFDDGNTSTAQNPSYSYSNPGQYNVSLTVTDDDGATDSIIQTIFVVIQELVDVNQSISDRGFPIHATASGNWGGAQNFTITQNTISSVDIYSRKAGTPEFNLTIEIRQDNPQGTLIDTVIFTPDEIPSSWQWIHVNINDMSVAPGTEMFIVLPPAPDWVTTSFGYEWGYTFGDVYDDGSFWFTRDGGFLWRDLPTRYEFAFRSYYLDI
jgi:PKD repeat protein